MELLLISDSKLKVVLTADDMTKYDITCDTIDYDNTETRRAFWNILDEAKHKTGFDAASDRVFIQVYPSKAGGCEMFVTKIEKRRDTLPAPSEPVKSVRKRYVYTFNEMKDLLGACLQLSENISVSESSVYRSDTNGKYYLIITGDVTPPRRSFLKQCDNEPYPAACEFGERIAGEDSWLYIREHFRCICGDDAIKKLAPLA